MKFQTGLSLAFVYIKRSYQDRRKIHVCKIMLVHFENKYGGEKQYGKQIIINMYIKYRDRKITACKIVSQQISPWVMVRVLVRVRVGGNLTWGNFPCTIEYITTCSFLCNQYILIMLQIKRRNYLAKHSIHYEKKILF